MTFPFNYVKKTDGLWSCQIIQEARGEIRSVFVCTLGNNFAARHLERVQPLSFLAFEGKWWLCSIKYFTSDMALLERGVMRRVEMERS